MRAASLILALALAGCETPPCVCTPMATTTSTATSTATAAPPVPVVPAAAAPNTMLQTLSVGGNVSTTAKLTKAECDAAKASAEKHVDLVDPATGAPHPSNILSAECSTVAAPAKPAKPNTKKPPP